MNEKVYQKVSAPLEASLTPLSSLQFKKIHITYWYNLFVEKQTKRVKLVVSIELAIALFFILSAGRASRSFYILYQSYFADIFLPFGFYFLLSLKGGKSNYLDTWWKRALAIFTLCATSEVLQYFGLFALARVFDPIDFVMYGVGILFAAFVDRKIFTRAFSFWD